MDKELLIFAEQLTHKKRPIFWSLYFLFLFAVILFLHSKLINRAHDDAYIHFRIARHFIQFGQPYFNRNEPVMGTSSPAWSLLLILIFKIFGPSPVSVSVMNALLICAGTILFANIFAHKARQFNTLLIVLYSLIYPSLMLFPSSGLMEISFCMFTVSLGLFLLTKRHPSGFSFLAMAVFIRYEMIILFGLIALVALLNRNTSRPLRISIKQFILFSFLGALPFLTFQLLFFRTLIPQTIIAKSLVYDLPFSHVFDLLISGLMPVGMQMGQVNWEICLTLILLLILISLATIFRRTSGDLLQFLDLPVLFTVSGVVIFSLYLIDRVFLFEWYIPLYSVPILLGVTSWFLSHPLKPIQWAGAFMGTALLTITIIQGNYIFRTPVEQISNFMDARVRTYLQLGRELAAKYPHTTLLAPEIGALGWGFDGKIIDSVGLISPEALKYHPMAVPQERSNGAIGAIPPGLVRETKPDLIVSYEVFIEAFRKSREIKDYIEIKRPPFLPEDFRRNPAGIWGSHTLSIFIRKH